MKHIAVQSPAQGTTRPSMTRVPMGYQLSTRGPVDLQANVTGTASLAKVEVVKDSEFVYATESGQRECTFNFHDPARRPAMSYY